MHPAPKQIKKEDFLTAKPNGSSFLPVFTGHIHRTRGKDGDGAGLAQRAGGNRGSQIVSDWATQTSATLAGLRGAGGAGEAILSHQG